MTAADAATVADHFFDRVLPWFGPYEDAMADEEPGLFHSLLSASINLGHLDPLDLCRRAEERYRKKKAPLASVEGFVRQVLGWREFVRHVYEEHREEYAARQRTSRPTSRFPTGTGARRRGCGVSTAR